MISSGTGWQLRLLSRARDIHHRSQRPLFEQPCVQTKMAKFHAHMSTLDISTCTTCTSIYLHVSLRLAPKMSNICLVNCVCMCSPSVLRCVVHAVHRLDFLCYFVQFSSFPVTSHHFSQVHMAQPLDVTVVLGNLAASQEKLQSEIRSMKDQLLAGQEDTAQRVAKLLPISDQLRTLLECFFRFFEGWSCLHAGSHYRCSLLDLFYNSLVELELSFVPFSLEIEGFLPPYALGHSLCSILLAGKELVLHRANL